jgi:hypothetical protein
MRRFDTPVRVLVISTDLADVVPSCELFIPSQPDTTVATDVARASRDVKGIEQRDMNN